MNKGSTLQLSPAEAVQLSQTWQGYLDEMATLREQMQRGREEIEQMQRNNAAALDNIHQILTRLGSR